MDPEGAGSSELGLSDSLLMSSYCCDVDNTNCPRGEQSQVRIDPNVANSLFKVKKIIGFYHFCQIGWEFFSKK